MKTLFTTAIALMILASFVTYFTKPEKTHNKPIIYWVTDANPVRAYQVDAFHTWLNETHPDVEMELRIDTTNGGHKTIIQAVSGVCGDIIDVSTWGSIDMYSKIGFLEDLNPVAKEHGFSVDKTFTSAADALQVEGKQVCFPCNLSVDLYWVNVGVFEDLGLKPPRSDWTLAQFVDLGKRYKEKVIEKHGSSANTQYFLANGISLLPILRNWGLDLFNETLTGSGLFQVDTEGQKVTDKKNLADGLRFKKELIDLKILPSAADLQSFTTESAHGGSGPQLFRNQQYALYSCGRWVLTTFRLYPEFKDFKLDVINLPHDGFPNTTAGTRAAALYAGNSPERKKLARYFLEFLASNAYSQTIIDSADALPPNPVYTESQEFKNPEAYPNEHGLHEKFTEAMHTIGIFTSSSPYITASYINSNLRKAEDAANTEGGIYSIEEIADNLHQLISDRVTQNLRENSELVAAYEKDMQDQRTINKLKAAGQKIPRALIKNPYYLRYYEAKGMLE